jgi:hypothetical protein
MLYQRHFMITVRHFNNQESVGKLLLDFSLIYDTLLAIGIFALVTEQLKWPRLLGKRSGHPSA